MIKHVGEAATCSEQTTMAAAAATSAPCALHRLREVELRLDSILQVYEFIIL
jgi:hypothetical protein